MDLAHFVAATIGQKSTPKKCTVLSAVQIDFFRRRYQRSQRKQRLKKNLHLSYRTAIQTATQMVTNKPYHLAKRGRKERLVEALEIGPTKANFF